MKSGVRVAALGAALWVGHWPAQAQSSGPTASPTSLSFAYQSNSTILPAPAKVTVSLPAASSPSATLRAVSSVLWLAVTPDTGHSPLALTVTANPTSLTPGSYLATITVNTVPPGSNPAVISVTLSISNPPSTLLVTSPSANYAPAASGTNPRLSFSYTTGDITVSPAQSELDVSTTGSDPISFNVTAGAGKGAGKTAVWIRVNGSGGMLPNLTTSGVTFSGSSVPIYVTLDLPTVLTLVPGSYSLSITVAANNAANGTAVVDVTLVVSAGGPGISSIFPTNVVANPLTDPVLTIYGDNFFSTSVVTMQLGTNQPITLPSTLLSRKVLQGTIKAAYLAAPTPAPVYPIRWVIAVTNPAPPNNPTQAPATINFFVDDPSQPGITSVVNAASFLPASVFTGTGTNPLAPPNPPTAVSPRGIISIFGRNLGPASVSPATPSGTPSAYPTTWGNPAVQVVFVITDPNPLNPPTFTQLAPIIMTSVNQINAIVPVEVATALTAVPPLVWVQVINGGIASTPAAPGFPLTAVAVDPGAFTFGGLGQGQAAVLNFDSTTGSYLINTSKNGAPRGSTISIYATGLGDLLSPLANGEVASAAVKVNGPTRVDIDGQPAVVTYAGTSPGSVAGLVQINAIVPPTVRTGAAISMTVSVGNTPDSRKSQPGVTVSIK